MSISPAYQSSVVALDFTYFQNKVDKVNFIKDAEESNILKVKKYIIDVVNLQIDKSHIKLPSISAMSDFFHASEEDIKRSLIELKKMGFEYLILDNNEPIIMWDGLLQIICDN